MEIKKKFIGSFVFIKKLAREVEVNEENKSTLISYNQRHLFVIESPKKAIPAAKKPATKKPQPKKIKGNADTPKDDSE